MSTYTVDIRVTGNFFLKIEADSAETAEAIANKDWSHKS